ncbi:MAG: hypothetical protein ACI3XJ_11415 [Oscillospiraceae bacterium]
MKLRIIFSMALAVALVSATAVTAFAAEDTSSAAPAEEKISSAAPVEENISSSYGYLAGQQRSTNRHAQFAQAADLTTDAERETFFAENEIGGAYSDGQQLDVEALVEAGVIDQATADSIREYAAAKQTQLHGRYGSLGGMTPAERHTFYGSFDRNGGNSVESLLDAGVITQEQADAINAYLG